LIADSKPKPKKNQIFELKKVMQEMKQSIGRSLDSFLDFLIIKEKTHVTILPFLSHFPGLVHFIYVDRLNHQVIFFFLFLFFFFLFFLYFFSILLNRL